MDLVQELNTYDEQKVLRILAKRNALTNFPRQKRPLFVIKYGPAASGKSSLPVKKWFQTMKVKYEDVLHINIDDLVESVEYFKTRSRKEAIPLFSKITSANNLARLPIDSIRSLAGIYTSVRTMKNSKGLSLADKFDDLLLKALQSKIHISIETTGTNSWPQWLFQGAFGKLIQMYHVTVIFPLVSIDTGYRRYIGRAKGMYNQPGSGVRLASTREHYRQAYQESYRHFQDAMKDPKQTAFIDDVYALVDEQVLPWPMVRA